MAIAHTTTTVCSVPPAMRDRKRYITIVVNVANMVGSARDRRHHAQHTTHGGLARAEQQFRARVDSHRAVTVTCA